MEEFLRLLALAILHACAVALQRGALGVCRVFVWLNGDDNRRRGASMSNSGKSAGERQRQKEEQERDERQLRRIKALEGALEFADELFGDRTMKRVLLLHDLLYDDEGAEVPRARVDLLHAREVTAKIFGGAPSMTRERFAEATINVYERVFLEEGDDDDEGDD